MSKNKVEKNKKVEYSDKELKVTGQKSKCQNPD